MRTALVIFAASIAVLVSGCSSTVQPEVAASSVVDVVSKQTGYKPTDVECPTGVEAKVGKKFDCTFTGPDGKYTAHVRITEVDGGNVNFYVETRRDG